MSLGEHRREGLCSGFIYNPEWTRLMILIIIMNEVSGLQSRLETI